MFRILRSPLRDVNIVWIKFAVSASFFVVLACDIEKTSSNDISKLLRLSCSCDGKPADASSWSQLLSIALSVSYADREDRLVSLDRQSNVDQKSNNWTVQVTNSEFSGGGIKARLEVEIGVSSRTGLMKFKCIFVALDELFKHQHLEKYVYFQAPVGYTPTASHLTQTVPATSARAPIHPKVTTQSSQNNVLTKTSNDATWVVTMPSRRSVTSPVTERSIANETRNSSAYLAVTKEQMHASEGKEGHFSSHLSLASACATLAVLGAFVLTAVMWLTIRWRRRHLRSLGLPEPHRPVRGTLLQDLIALGQLSDILSSNKRLPNGVHTAEETAYQRDSHIYESPYAVCCIEDSEHAERTSEAENFYAIHPPEQVLTTSAGECDEATRNASPKHSNMARAQNTSKEKTLYLTPAPEVKKAQENLSTEFTSPYITACELHQYN